ncbi:zeta toxin family protein [Streptomyces sp. NBC_01304]|uniref:zeta toxin family protein n=1 Tax=Streptomyces sp. NBC_01304 TaxID=2903818 RepID=UPI002E11E4B6|nr:zeta toxin family protein [Streptomyces sp. NBC_01304]
MLLLVPGGHLAEDLFGLGDDVLGWAIRHGRPDDVERIADELDRRYPPAPLPEAADAHTTPSGGSPSASTPNMQQRTAHSGEQLREMYRDRSWAQYTAAEEANYGYLLSREEHAAGVDLRKSVQRSRAHRVHPRLGRADARPLLARSDAARISTALSGRPGSAPRAILMTGMPGAGKTTLARALEQAASAAPRARSATPSSISARWCT